MDIHKPKAAHSWREFLIEIGTIICGILIALSLEQVIEALRAEHQLEAARQIIAHELSLNVTGAVQRMRLSKCLDERLNEVAGILDQAERTGRLPPLPLPGRPRMSVYNDGGFNSIVTSQVAEHLPKAQFAELATAYTYSRKLDPLVTAEMHQMTALYTMSGPGRPVTPAEVSRLRAALTLARSMNLEMALYSTRLLQHAKAARLDYVPEDARRVEAAASSPLAAIDTGHMCLARPNDIPTNYGQTPMAAAIQVVDAETAKGLTLAH